MGATSITELSRHLHARGLTRRGGDDCNPPFPPEHPFAMTERSGTDASDDDEAVRAIVDASDARVFRIDRAMRLTWANRASRERHGLAERTTGSLSEVFDAQKRAGTRCLGEDEMAKRARGRQEISCRVFCIEPRFEGVPAQRKVAL
jgi:PAS domain-containing protein